MGRHAARLWPEKRPANLAGKSDAQHTQDSGRRYEAVPDAHRAMLMPVFLFPISASPLG